MAKEKKAKKEEKIEAVETAADVKLTPRLFTFYKEEVIPQLKERFSYKNIMEVPKLEKIVVNMGIGGAVQDSKLLEEAVRDLEAITGQKASIRAAKQSISNFKLREGMKIGAKVTLRRERMYEFLDRLISVALPRVRDFRGISDKSFDGRGNYTLGIKEQIIFPEINVDRITRVVGMDITFVTSAKSDNEAFELLTAFGVPFRKKENQ
ncbi:MAG: 50S ribosomal protein L5 [Melioribacteraceae bacterium]|jgi:large subunit ribosomal protein L5|nr:50S ribosomal protein L5 [Ignavibacteriota bacterium]MBZ0183890.1 50S ribosomal protein L5 [Melioribacteraceae bacterium]